MKKTIIIIIVIGMLFSWTIYDFGKTSIDSKETKNTDIGIEVGNIAPDFELATLDGGNIRLSEFRGQPVILNFWATWCPPCRAEMPDMQKLYENKDVVILAVNLIESERRQKDVGNFVKEFSLTFPILLDKDMKVANLYRIQPIPTSFMIDSSGRIQGKSLGALNYESMVQELEKMK